MNDRELLKVIQEAYDNELTGLDLWNNQLTEIPPEIGRLTNLTWINLRNNQLTKIPPEIGRLTSLTMLYLENNLLTKIPPEIGRLTNLTRLYLGYNQLTKIPPEIGRLNLCSIWASQHKILYSTESLSIGCIDESPEWWLENYAGVGREHDYTDEQIEEYGLFIEAIAAYHAARKERFGT